MKNELDCVYKGKEFKLKKNSPTYLSIKYLSIKDDKSDDSDSIIIEDWAEKVCNKATFIAKGKLYGHLNKSGCARIVSIDELDMKT
jgi:hypothetical protein